MAGESERLMDLEVEIDRLLMKVVEIGQLVDVEDALRAARRQLYTGMVVGARIRIPANRNCGLEFPAPPDPLLRLSTDGRLDLRGRRATGPKRIGPPSQSRA